MGSLAGLVRARSFFCDCIAGTAILMRTHSIKSDTARKEITAPLRMLRLWRSRDSRIALACAIASHLLLDADKIVSLSLRRRQAGCFFRDRYCLWKAASLREARCERLKMCGVSEMAQLS